jgi:hypothetical protein
MSETSRTVKIIMNNGETHSYENARIDLDTEGWIIVYSLKDFPEKAAELVAEFNRLEVSSWEYE